jgi:hypothetical protein
MNRFISRDISKDLVKKLRIIIIIIISASKFLKIVH